MTPGARLSAAVTVLDRVLAGMPAEAALTRWARGARYAGARDRAAVRDHVYQALRCRRSHACLGGALSGRGLMLGSLRAAGEDPALLFTGEGHAPAPLTETEARGGRAPLCDGDRLDLPDWLVEAFRASLGAQAEAAAEALRHRAPVMLRVNRRMNTRSEAIDILTRDGIEAEPVEICPTALRVTRGARRVVRSRAYLEGRVELQDGSSQAAMEEISVAPGARVLDICAGGGGKTLALAARLEGRWFAHDADAGRMRDLPRRARRAGIDVTCLAPGQAAADAPYDLVLCDVPCSGSGTWRRNPDAKWRLTPQDLAGLRATQGEILRQAADLVAPGGALAYVTCSLLRCENEAQIRQFLSDTAGWEISRERRWPVSDVGDGFYFAEMTKRGGDRSTLTGGSQRS